MVADTWDRRLRRWLGLVMLSISGLGVFGMATHPPPGSAVPGLIVLAMLGLGGAFTWRSGLVSRKAPQVDASALEQLVLAAARRRQGRITVSELALDLECGTSEAQNHLDALVTARAAEIDVGATGMVIYVFRSFEAAEAARATEVEKLQLARQADTLSRK